jgi:hypothetical protein
MFDKRALAEAALRAAELQTGVTPVVDQVRANSAAVVAGSESDSASEKLSLQAEPEVTAATTQALPLNPAVAALVPGGRLKPGAVISVIGSRWLLFTLWGAASGAGAWAAVVGAADASAVAVAQAGVALERVVLVPEPGVNVAAVCAALLEAMCVVVGRNIVLSDAEKRRLAARARERGTIIISETPWPGAWLNFQIRNRTWEGADHGEGWLQRCQLDVERTGRGQAAQPKLFQVSLAL